jgi:uncharacterized coiled-coil protein SlyX
MSLEQKQQQVKRRGDVLKYEDNDGHLFIKAFLLSSDVNINRWGVTNQSLDQYINTFIGKPLVLTESFNHPLPPSDYKVGDEVETGRDSYETEPVTTNYYDDDNNPNNVVKVNDIIDHWLAYQEPFRVGNIIDIVKKGSTYYSIIEITDDFTKKAFRNNDLPLFVSPAIAQLDPYEAASNISKWTGIHLAIVSNPAYTIKKALISGQCHDEQNKCLLQLRNASVAENRKLKKLDCGFCRQKALRRYANKVQYEQGVLHWASNYDDFLNSSVLSTNPILKIENILTATTDSEQNNNHNNNNNNNNNSQNNNNKQSEPTTNYEANRQNNDNPDDDSTEQHPNTDTSNEQPAGKSSSSSSSSAAAGAEQPTISKEKQTQTKVITNENETEVKKTADTSQCIQILAQVGLQDPAQAEQVCQMIQQSFVDSYNTPAQNKSMGSPPQSGQISSVDELNKTIAKQAATIEKLNDDLKLTKRNDKSDTQRIAELEEQIKILNGTLKEKELESYLTAKIADEKTRSDKVKRFATLGLTIEDLKEVYGDDDDNNKSIKKTAEVVVVETQPLAQGKVKLQTASTNEDDSESSSNSNKIRDANNRIVSSLRAKNGVY